MSGLRENAFTRQSCRTHDRRFFDESMRAAFGIDEETFHKTGECVINETPNFQYKQIHRQSLSIAWSFVAHSAGSCPLTKDRE
jgi:hypothetical protein